MVKEREKGDPFSSQFSIAQVYYVTRPSYVCTCVEELILGRGGKGRPLFSPIVRTFFSPSFFIILVTSDGRKLFGHYAKDCATNLRLDRPLRGWGLTQSPACRASSIKDAAGGARHEGLAGLVQVGEREDRP